MLGQLEYFIQLEKQKEGGSWWWEVGQMGSGVGQRYPEVKILEVAPLSISGLLSLSSRTFSVKSLEPCIMNPCVLAQ